MPSRVLGFMVFSLSLFLLPALGAGETMKIDLKTAVSKALQVSPELKQAQAALLFAEARLQEARGYRYPQIEAIGLLAPAPNARGDHIYSPDKANELNGLGLYTRFDISAIQPLYTFGRLEESLKAAGKGIDVEQAGRDLKASEVVFKVHELYYGLTMAREGKVLLDEVLELLDSSRKRTQKLLDADSPSVSPMDLYKLDAFEGLVKNLGAEVISGLELAQRALARVTGLEGQSLEPAEPHLMPVKVSLESLASYQDQANNRRPEMRQLKEGLQALDSMVKAAEAERLPVIFLGAFFSYAWAPDRTDIDNPFIIDEFNHVWGGGGLGARFQLNFGITEGKIAQAKAERLKYQALESFARMNLPLDVSQAYLKLKQADQQMEATAQAYRAARRWLVAASSNFDMGVGPVKEVVDALEKYVTQKALHFKAVHDYNVGWARLLKAAGANYTGVE